MNNLFIHLQAVCTVETRYHTLSSVSQMNELGDKEEMSMQAQPQLAMLHPQAGMQRNCKLGDMVNHAFA